MLERAGRHLKQATLTFPVFVAMVALYALCHSGVASDSAEATKNPVTDVTPATARGQ
jgi:hypothetical protein